MREGFVVLLAGVASSLWFLIGSRSRKRDEGLEYRVKWFGEKNLSSVIRDNRRGLREGIFVSILIAVLGLVKILSSL